MGWKPKTWMGWSDIQINSGDTHVGWGKLHIKWLGWKLKQAAFPKIKQFIHTENREMCSGHQNNKCPVCTGWQISSCKGLSHLVQWVQHCPLKFCLLSLLSSRICLRKTEAENSSLGQAFAKAEFLSDSLRIISKNELIKISLCCNWVFAVSIATELCYMDCNIIICYIDIAWVGESPVLQKLFLWLYKLGNSVNSLAKQNKNINTQRKYKDNGF